MTFPASFVVFVWKIAGRVFWWGIWVVWGRALWWMGRGETGCEGVKGRFRASLHMGSLDIRGLGGGDGSEGSLG